LTAPLFTVVGTQLVNIKRGLKEKNAENVE
jgi:hypothetical protein